MLLLQNFVLASVIVHQAANALPLPVHLEIEGVQAVTPVRVQMEDDDLNVQQIPFNINSYTFNSNDAGVILASHSSGSITMTSPNRDTIHGSLYILPDYDEEDLARRGMFGMMAKAGVGLIKAGAKSGAINVVTNGASKLLKLKRRDAEDGEQQLVKRGGGIKKFFFKSAKAAGPAAKVKTGGGGGVMNTINNVGTIGMLASSFLPMLGSLGKSKTPEAAAAAAPPPAAVQPAKAAPAEKHAPPAPHPKRSFEETDAEQSLAKRGQVANMAGAAVTTLMFVNIGKQALGAVSSHLPGANRNMMGPIPVARYFEGDYDQEGMILNKRDKDESVHHEKPQSAPQQQRSRPGVMSSMSTVVTLGFGAQAIQENAKPMYRELKRIVHKGSKLIFPHPSAQAGPAARGLRFQDDGDLNLVSRNIEEQEQVELQRRGMIPAVVAKHAPMMMNTVGHIVTTSMLVSMATPFVDSTIKTIKGPNHPDNRRHSQVPMKRSLFIEDDFNADAAPLHPSSALAHPIIDERIRSRRLARLQAKQQQQQDDDIEEVNIEKRGFNLGKVMGKVMSHPVTKTTLSMVGLAI